MYKIDIKGTAEHLQRISIFLDNNHIQLNVVEEAINCHSLEELVESIEWSF